ncbi:MAG: HupE/UreJ family protein, partial [Cyanobacteria bacterium J06633_1]
GFTPNFGNCMNKNKAIAIGLASSVFLSLSLLFNDPALAHHPSGGEIPGNFIEGFLSGVGHPVIGIDHLVFVIAIGLLAALSNKLGLIIPTTFVVATAVGTVIHLQSIDLPGAELIISASVLVIGIFLAQRNQANFALITIAAAIAGIFHGYAYGESIIGAEATALGAYLFGFCSIQFVISAIAFYLGQKVLNQPHKSALLLRFAGFTVCGIGFAFLSNALFG